MLAAERGARVLRATPGEGEERHSFAVLQDLFRDVELDGVALREPVRHALMVALLREPAAAPVDGQAVNLGVHDVLEGLAGEREVVVFVDDVQWADAASLESLAYAARRLGDSVGPVRPDPTGRVRPHRSRGDAGASGAGRRRAGAADREGDRAAS